MPIRLRLATEDDSASILKIYSEFITKTAITFEVDVPSVLEFSRRIKSVLEKFPWIVCEMNGVIVGYAYASKHRERAAYQWSVDASVYVHPEYHGKHIATALYTALTALLKMQGYYNVYAGVTLPNIKSEGFHESFGFKPVGVFSHVGYKMGEWRDVKWFALKISEYSNTPETPKLIQDIKDTEEFGNILEDAARKVRA